MFKPVKVPYEISSSIEEDENHIKVKVSVTPYDGYKQEKLVLLDYSHAVNILKEKNIPFEDCINKEVTINNKKVNQSSKIWIFLKPLTKNNEKVLDKSSKDVIIDIEEGVYVTKTKTKSRSKKSKRHPKKTHKLLGDEDVGGVLV